MADKQVFLQSFSGISKALYLISCECSKRELYRENGTKMFSLNDPLS